MPSPASCCNKIVIKSHRSESSWRFHNHKTHTEEISSFGGVENGNNGRGGGWIYIYHICFVTASCYYAPSVCLCMVGLLRLGMLLFSYLVRVRINVHSTMWTCRQRWKRCHTTPTADECIEMAQLREGTEKKDHRNGWSGLCTDGYVAPQNSCIFKFIVSRQFHFHPQFIQFLPWRWYRLHLFFYGTNFEESE